jgi:hypothetical protein
MYHVCVKFNIHLCDKTFTNMTTTVNMTAELFIQMDDATNTDILINIIICFASELQGVFVFCVSKH